MRGLRGRRVRAREPDGVRAVPRERRRPRSGALRKLHHLQRELKLRVVAQLMRRRVDEESNRLRQDYFEVLMEITNLI